MKPGKHAVRNAVNILWPTWGGHSTRVLNPVEQPVSWLTDPDTEIVAILTEYHDNTAIAAAVAEIAQWIDQQLAAERPAKWVAREAANANRELAAELTASYRD